MSRTVRTTPRQLRVREGAWESAFLYDLRYANAEMARAAREGRRPAPVKTLRQIASWQWMVLYCRRARSPPRSLRPRAAPGSRDDSSPSGFAGCTTPATTLTTRTCRRSVTVMVCCGMPGRGEAPRTDRHSRA